jgi:hypothetical protein
VEHNIYLAYTLLGYERRTPTSRVRHPSRSRADD